LERKKKDKVVKKTADAVKRDCSHKFVAILAIPSSLVDCFGLLSTSGNQLPLSKVTRYFLTASVSGFGN